MMRLLHTSDWHLGQTLHDFSREPEHARFLSWLLDVMAEMAVDALLVTGDIFDNQNPPIEAVRALYRFIAAARRRLPDLQIVLIGGNHDSSGRLEAPSPLLSEFGVHVVGSLPRRPDGRIDHDRLLIPLTEAGGGAGCLCAAVPYLRPADLPVTEGDDALVGGARAIYSEVFAAAQARRMSGQAIVVTGHCYVAGTELSALSERRILGGNQHALPADIFPDDDNVAYVALGHLHKPQAVGGRAALRYAGSPIPLSLGERNYRHQVVVADFDGGHLSDLKVVPVPRAVDILRVPDEGAADPDQVLAALRALNVGTDPGRHLRAYLEVVVALARPAPTLRAEIEQAIDGKPVRLARVAVEVLGAGGTLADAEMAEPELRSLHPEGVFVRLYHREYAGAADDDLLTAFRLLLEDVERQAEDVGA